MINFSKVLMYLQNTKISFYINEKVRRVISVLQCTHKKSAEAKSPCAMTAAAAAAVAAALPGKT